MRFRVPLVGAILAAAVLITVGSAAGGPASVTTGIDLSSRASVMAYLASIKVDTRGMVVQLGARNYAGPRCPGAGWTCTRSVRVVQFSVRAGGDNRFECTPSSSSTSTPPTGCVIVQLGTGNNSARCIERSTAADATQHCTITQTTTSGKNSATVEQTIEQKDPASAAATSCGADQCATQTAKVEQSNQTGDNDLNLKQRVDQKLKEGGASVDQNQVADQAYEIQQNCSTSTDPCSPSNDAKCVNAFGKNTSDADQNTKQEEEASQATTGTQRQESVQDGNHVNQCGVGVSTNHNRLDASQKEHAKGSDVSQFQDPRQACCSDQQGNSKNTFDIDEHASQKADTPAYQYEDQEANCTSSGNCSVKQDLEQNGQHSKQSCSDTSCHVFNSLGGGGDFRIAGGSSYRARPVGVVGRSSLRAFPNF